MDPRDDIKFVPLRDDSNNVVDLEDLVLVTEPCSNPSHGLNPSPLESDSTRRITSIVLMGVHMTRRTIGRTIRRELGLQTEETESRLTRMEGKMVELEGYIGNLKGTVGEHEGDMGQLKGTVEKHEGDIGQLKGGMKNLEKTMTEIKGSFQQELENLKKIVLGSDKQLTNVVQKEDAAAAGSGPTTSNNCEEIEGTSRTSAEPPVPQSGADAAAANDMRAAGSANKHGQNLQIEGNANPGLMSHGEVTAVRIQENVPDVPQIVAAHGNNSDKVDKSRRPCKYCEKSLSVTYVVTHEIYKCPLGVRLAAKRRTKRRKSRKMK